MDEKHDVLKRYFGYDSFRPGQEELIDAMMAGRDTFGVMPTGAGKSVCYQVPALLCDGISLVVSPLVSLMKDQVMALVQMGVKAAYMNSSLTPAQFRVVLRRAYQGQYKIIYVAPERLLTDSFLRFAGSAPLRYVTVDEAHCVSKWGQDFRPGYLDIGPFVQSLPRRPVLSAFTATATQKVREDIVNLLGLNDPATVITGFDRKNLFYEVRHPSDKKAELLRIVKDFRNRSGIVYCATRRTVGEVTDFLVEQGMNAAAYHAGLPSDERSKAQEDFIHDRKNVMVATNAFGMGIDKSNVSYVVHYNMPGDMESYYQEAGRAGRDGSPAQCILLYAGKDVRTQMYFIEHMGETSSLEGNALAQQQELARQRLKSMMGYCFTTGCLRSYILGYFGESAPASCDNCGSCKRVCEAVDITIDAQKILSCVKRVKESRGISVVVDILRGSKAEKLRSQGLDALSTYGLMKDTPVQRLRDMIRFLMQEGYLAVSDGEYPLLLLGPRASEVLKERKGIIARLPQIGDRRTRNEEKKRRGTALASSGLYEELRALRQKIASERGIPAFMVFSNATLLDMSEKMPETYTEFLEVSGVGEVKAERYGDRFIRLICAYVKK